MSLAGPAPRPDQPVCASARDLRAERAATVPFPPGDDTLQRSRAPARFARDPLPLLLDAYERYGPVFTLRVFHGSSRLHARPGGQPPHAGLPRRTTSVARGPHGRPHPAARRRPADDRRRLPPPLAPDHAARLPPRADRAATARRWTRSRRRARRAGAPATRSTSTHWTRRLALRIAMRALFGLDPDRAHGRRARRRARSSRTALGFCVARLPPAGPARAAARRSARMQRARARSSTR